MISAEGGADSGVISDSGAGVDSGILGANCPAADAGGTFAEAPHGPLPTVVYNGGGILQAPQIITFTFPTTPSVPAIQAFGQTITQTSWFATVTKDYCVPDGGPCIAAGAPGISVEMTAVAAPVYVDLMGQGTATTGVDLDTFVNQQIAAAVAAHTIPAPFPNALYAFYFPPSSTIWMGPEGQGAESCQAFGAYHNSITYTDGTTQIVYAIMPDCTTGDPMLDFEYTTVGASHEFIEATTDPYVGSNSIGWYLDQANSPPPTVAQIRNDPWATAVSYGEVADNCESLFNSAITLDGGVQVQRIWSPSAAALGHNPCIPVPAGEAYYNASPDKVLYVANVGDSFTVDVSAFSDMARGPWRLDAVDGTPTGMTDSSGNPIQYLKLEFVGGVDTSDGVTHLLCVNNGSTGQLKVTLVADPDTDMSLQQQDEWPEADGILYSADVSQTTYTPGPDGGLQPQFPYQFWPFAVVTPATAASLGVGDGGVQDMHKLAQLRAARRHSQPVRDLPSPGVRRYVPRPM
jgi:hypothetical protein